MCRNFHYKYTVSLRESPFLPEGFPTRYKTPLTFIMEIPTHGSTVLKLKNLPVSIANVYPYTWKYILYINSLAPGQFEWNFRHVIFKQIIVIDGWGICCKIALIWMSLEFSDDQSTLVQVMAWCRQATSHYLSQCWHRSLSPTGVTRSQWVKSSTYSPRSLSHTSPPKLHRTHREFAAPPVPHWPPCPTPAPLSHTGPPAPHQPPCPTSAPLSHTHLCCRACMLHLLIST